jgi:hypothetical protein
MHGTGREIAREQNDRRGDDGNSDDEVTKCGKTIKGITAAESQGLWPGAAHRGELFIPPPWLEGFRITEHGICAAAASMTA